MAYNYISRAQTQNGAIMEIAENVCNTARSSVMNKLGKPSKKNKKKCGFFPHWRGGVNPESTLFVQFYFFFINFVPFYPVFVGWKVIFRVKVDNFPPPKMCFHTLAGGGRGGPRGVEKIHTFYFFFLNAFPRNIETTSTKHYTR